MVMFAIMDSVIRFKIESGGETDTSNLKTVYIVPASKQSRNTWGL